MNKDFLSQAELATNAETWQHINLVMQLLAKMQIELMMRAFTHDRSKLSPPEVSTFTEQTSKLAGTTYGTPEYHQLLSEMKPALDHHYAHNRHHPEFFPKPATSEVEQQNNQDIKHLREIEAVLQNFGLLSPADSNLINRVHEKLLKESLESTSQVGEMNLIDLLEMFCDWYAATKRHNDGNIYKSIEINRKRFAISDQLADIFLNSVELVNKSNGFENLKTQKDI
jgi:hypothetical protein